MQTVQRHSKLLVCISAPAFLVALLTLLGGLSPSADNWGYHHLAYLPKLWTFMVPVLMILVLLNAVQKKIITLIEYSADRWKLIPRRMRTLASMLFLLGLGLFFWTLRERLYFLGDGFLFIRTLPAVSSPAQVATSFKDEPLAGCVVWFIYKLLPWGVGMDRAATSFQLLSILSGVGTVWVLTVFLRHLPMTPAERILIPLCILGSGASQLFFGYVETYPLSFFLLLGLVSCSFRYLDKATSLITPAIISALLVVSYFGMIFILPMPLYLGIIELKRKRYLTLTLAVTAFLATVSLVLWYCGYTPDYLFHMLTGGDDHFLPIFKTTQYYQSYTLFSLGHLIDLLNLHLLIAPLSLFLLILVGAMNGSLEGSDNRQKITLLIVLTGCCLLSSSLLNAELGVSRDWDLFAPIMMGFVIPSFLLWGFMQIDGDIRKRVLVIIALISILHTLPWIVANGNAKRYFTRFTSLQETACWSRHAVIDANEEMGIYFREMEKYPEAIHYLRVAAITDSTHSRLWSSLGRLYLAANKPDSAIRSYETALHFDSTRWRDYVMLGAIYGSQRRYDDAIFYTKKAISLNADSGVVFDNLGVYLCEGKQAYAQALPLFLHAIMLDSTDAQSYYDAGLCYNAMGMKGEMQQYFGRFLRLEPSSQRADFVRSMLSSASER